MCGESGDAILSEPVDRTNSIVAAALGLIPFHLDETSVENISLVVLVEFLIGVPMFLDLMGVSSSGPRKHAY